MDADTAGSLGFKNANERLGAGIRRAFLENRILPTFFGQMNLHIIQYPNSKHLPVSPLALSSAQTSHHLTPKSHAKPFASTPPPLISSPAFALIGIYSYPSTTAPLCPWSPLLTRTRVSSSNPPNRTQDLYSNSPTQPPESPLPKKPLRETHAQPNMNEVDRRPGCVLTSRTRLIYIDHIHPELRIGDCHLGSGKGAGPL